jgi:hypothetical protein
VGCEISDQLNHVLSPVCAGATHMGRAPTCARRQVRKT